MTNLLLKPYREIVSVKEISKGKWRVRVQIPTARKSASGKRQYQDVQKNFTTKSAAEAWERHLRQNQRTTGSEQALTISEIAEYREAKAQAQGKDLREVTGYWAAHHPPGGDITCMDAVKAYMGSKEWTAFSPSTQANIKSKTKYFLRTFGERLLSTVTLEEVERYTDAIPSRVDRNNHIRCLKTFFKWCTRRGHRYLTHSPINDLETELVDYGTPSFLMVDEVKRLFGKAIELDTQMIPLLALGCFAGIRTYEILRLESRDFHLKEKRINVRAEVAKPKRQGKPLPRLIEDLPDALWQWLSAVGFDGNIDCANYSKRRSDIYHAADITWSNSMARHTFATYAYAFYRGDSRVRKWTGHRGDDSILLTHYAGHVTHDQGKAYFDIKPPRKRIKPFREVSVFSNRADWPADEDLLKKVDETSRAVVARELGVSWTAVNKRVGRLRGV